MVPAWKRYVFGKCRKGRIVTSVEKNITRITSILNITYTTPSDCAELEYHKTTIDVTLENKSKSGILGSFRKMANLKFIFIFMPCTRS